MANAMTPGVSNRTKNSPLVGGLLLLLALAQIFSGQVPEWLGIGRSVSEQSAATSHPLVPLGPAFAIWGVIYLWAVIAAVWAMFNPNKDVVKIAWPHMAVIWALNTAWSIWVPIHGIEWVSLGIICVSLVSGLSGLYRLKSLVLSPSDTGFFVVPLALVSGWITAASVVNLTSALVASGLQPNPREVMVSLAFLVGLILFAGAMLRLTRSRLYALPLLWALSWIAVANRVRQDEPMMVYTALAGIGLLLLLLFTLKGQSKARLPG